MRTQINYYVYYEYYTSMQYSEKWRINITVTTLTGKMSMDGHINLNYLLWEVWTRGPLSKWMRQQHDANNRCFILPKHLRLRQGRILNFSLTRPNDPFLMYDLFNVNNVISHTTEMSHKIKRKWSYHP